MLIGLFSLMIKGVYFDDSLVSWSTKKQHVIARSRIELEYRAFAQVVAKIVYNLFFKN